MKSPVSEIRIEIGFDASGYEKALRDYLAGIVNVAIDTPEWRDKIANHAAEMLMDFTQFAVVKP
ncbi:hypothetical protein CIW54_07715 [Paraburkholderia sp. T12-10]|nr:hypothetical protein CIW54_07715 [Paraburkholderia sp. T12-10]